MGGAFGGKEYGPSPTSVIPEDILGLRGQLAGWLGGQMNQPGTKVPGLSNISKAFEALMSTTAGKGIMPEQSKTISQMISTGAPFSETEFFKTAEPVYRDKLADALAQSKESAGMTGSTRSTGAEEALGHAAGQELNEFMKYMTGIASASHEQAQARRLQGVGAGFQEAMLPGMMAGQAQGIAQAKAPFLPAALQLATGFAPIGAADMMVEEGWLPPMLEAAVPRCCFIFIEGNDGELEESVRRFRDAHYGADSSVSRGYKRMAKWLVPQMKKRAWVKSLVKTVMLTPLARVARWVEGEDKWGWLFIGVGHIWVSIWRLYGISFRSLSSRRGDRVGLFLGTLL